MRIFVVVVATLLSLAFAPAAQATRPIVGFDYPDVCYNIRGQQPIYEVLGRGPYDFNLATHKRKHDCVRVTHP